MNELCVFVFTSPDLRWVNVKCESFILEIIYCIYFVCVLSDGEEHNLYLFIYLFYKTIMS